MGPTTGKFVVMYGLTYTPDYKSGGMGIIGLQIRWNWIRWNWGWETISWNTMKHLRRDNHLMWIIWWRDESFGTWWIIWDVINHVSTLFICLLYLFRNRSIYSLAVEDISYRHRSISSSGIEVYLLFLWISFPISGLLLSIVLRPVQHRQEAQFAGTGSDLLAALEAVSYPLPKPLVIHYPQWTVNGLTSE